MKAAIAVALLLGVYLRHFSIWGGLWEGSTFSPQAIFYMLGGAWEALLCLLIGILLLAYEKSCWRELALIGAVIGMIEGATTPICRYFTPNIFAVPKNIDLCDYLMGLPFQAWRLTFYLLVIAAWSLWENNNAIKRA